MPPRSTSTTATDAVPADAVPDPDDAGPSDDPAFDEPAVDHGPVDETALHGPAGDEPAAARPSGSASHDAVWFEGVVRAYAGAVHRFLVRRTGRDEADDLAADVLTTAWRRRADVPDGAELPWLYRTAGFVVANHRRKGRPVPVGDVPDDVLGAGDPAAVLIDDERVRTVLGSLSARDRQILLLNAWEGLVGDALADVLGISRGGADAALSRARARLREAWAAADA